MRHRALLFGTLVAVIGLLFLDGAFHTANIFTQTAVAQDDAGPAADGGGAEEPPDELNALQWLYRSLGPFYLIVFLSLSFTLVALLVMNLPSLEKFAPKVAKGGLIVVNTSLVHRDPKREDCTVVKVDARHVAGLAGTERAANLVMLGAYVAATGIVEPASVEREIENEFTGGKARHVPSNIAAFRAGLEAGRPEPAERDA